jgi:hypothetical protein
MRYLVILLLVPALIAGSLLDDLRKEARQYNFADPHQKYRREIETGLIRQRIVEAIALNRTCTILYDLDETEVSSAGSILLLRESYPDPFAVDSLRMGPNLTKIRICWTEPRDFAREIAFVLVVGAFVLFLFTR